MTKRLKWNILKKCELEVLPRKGRKIAAPSTLAAAAKSLQLCPTLCDPIDGSPPGSPIPGMLEHWSGLPFPSPMHESEK